ncbi:threonine aldolase family protein [uncultured Enterovirga sp.]|uniref:threonine aldolase family protein n=1 Tax=uncultured Enterovirga sp. TaxID=2026352 RepID=UPI0035CB813F
MGPDPVHLNFASDNVMGASAPVLEALVRASVGAMPAYGADDLTVEVERSFCDLFEREVAVFLVGTGTAANALALATLVSPWGLCLCHEEAHVIDEECGAPEFFTHGAKLHGLKGVGCKIDPATLRATLDGFSAHEKQMPAQAVSISQATESGLVYRPDEIAAIAEVCRERALRLHMDGARFANALVAQDVSPAAMTWRAGVDILSFGATKNGCLAAEAIVVFDPSLADTLTYRRKRSGQTFSKGRFLAAQFAGYLGQDHWLQNARHANAMARCLADGLAAVPGVRLAWEVQANEVFLIIPDDLDRRLKAGGAAYHPWSPRALSADEGVAPGEKLIRLVASFATKREAVDDLLTVASGP